MITTSNRATSERGQILVITAAALIVLLGIAALVVDLGFAWMLRRQEQNAADPGAIAAARWLKDASGNARDPRPEAYEEACFYAQMAGFFIGDSSDCAAARGAGELEVHWPPVSGDYSGHTDKVQVIIHATRPSFFGSILGAGETQVSTAAVAANTDDNSNSSSLVALKEECSGPSGGRVTGGGTVRIFPASGVTSGGGYVHVNQRCGSSSDDVCQNGSGSSALEISGGGTLIAPYAYSVGTCAFNGTSGSNPNPPGFYCDDTLTSSACLDEQAVPLGDPLAGLPEPQLSAFPNGVCPDGSSSTEASMNPCVLRSTVCPPISGVNTCILPPGVYYGGWDVQNNVRVQLGNGMYILAGGGIKLSGTGTEITTVDNATGTAARVTIFSTDGPRCGDAGFNNQCQGDVTFTANQIFKAKATPLGPDKVPPPELNCTNIMPGHNLCPWGGILLWQDGTASNPDAVVKLGGQASSILAGTIYAPLADVEIRGGSSGSGCTTGLSTSCLAIQIIAYTWTVNGGGLVEMPYDPAGIYQFAGRGLVE